MHVSPPVRGTCLRDAFAPPRHPEAAALAASEGAVVMARAERSIEPFDLVVEQLLGQVPPTSTVVL